MSAAARIARKFASGDSPISIYCEGQLRQPIVLSAIAFSVLGIWMMWMSRNLPIHMPLPDVDVTFEFICPPPEPRYHASETLTPINLEEGRQPLARSKIDKPIPTPGEAQRTQSVSKSERIASAVPPGAGGSIRSAGQYPGSTAS
jgi:hypothetical protein